MRSLSGRPHETKKSAMPQRCGIAVGNGSEHPDLRVKTGAVTPSSRPPRMGPVKPPPLPMMGGEKGFERRNRIHQIGRSNSNP